VDRLVKQFHEGGAIAAITCGWRDREDEDDALRRALGVEMINLRLRWRKQQVFERDPELAEAHRQRQKKLRHKQDFYRIRLEYALAAHDIIRSRNAPEDVEAQEQEASLNALKTLDQYHVDDCADIHQRFEMETSLATRPEVVRHREELREILSRCRSLAIAGGHVATIYNRLAFFGLTDALDGHTVFAWSAGAMAICDRIVLYHDSPPQGSGASQVLSRGVGWVPNLVFLPEPEKRLRRDPNRVSVLASRFRPARTFAVPTGAYLVCEDDRVTRLSGIEELEPNGRVERRETP